MKRCVNAVSCFRERVRVREGQPAARAIEGARGEARWGGALGGKMEGCAEGAGDTHNKQRACRRGEAVRCCASGQRRGSTRAKQRARGFCPGGRRFEGQEK